MPGNALQKIASSSSMQSLWENVTAIYQDLGFQSGAYYMLYPDKDQPIRSPYCYGFSEETSALFLSTDYQRLNIAPRVVIARGEIMTWTEIWESAHLTAEELAFRAYMKANVTPNPGLAIPCYGPRLKNGYFALTDYRIGLCLDSQFLAYVHLVAQASHLQLCQLIEEDADIRGISPREMEILSLVARGMSNAAIAEVLGISRHTTDMYLRRAYQKLKVTDRTSAAIKAVGLGLIAA